jgi:hypothetical protein
MRVTIPVMVDKFSKKELSVRLRKVLDELEKVCDEVIITYLDESDDRKPDDLPLLIVLNRRLMVILSIGKAIFLPGNIRSPIASPASSGRAALTMPLKNHPWRCHADIISATRHPTTRYAGTISAGSLS